MLERPTSLILTCADDGELAERLVWSTWTRTRATATGIVTWRTCIPDCADSTGWRSARAGVTLTAPVAEAGKGLLFTALKLHVTGRTPPRFMRNLTVDEAPVAALIPPLSRPGRRGQGPVAAPSGSLGYGQIEGYWLDAGGLNNNVTVSGKGTYTQAQVAAAITGPESSFLPGNIQPGVDYCGANSDRAGWGLWQITCGNSVPRYGTDFQLLDPWNNAEAAVFKCKNDVAGGYNCFAPWTTYATGAYVQYLQHTGADTSLTDPGEYVQVHSTPNGTPSSPPADPGSTYGPPMPGSQPSQDLVLNGGFTSNTYGWSTLNGANLVVYGPNPQGTSPYGSPGYAATNSSQSGGSIYQDIPVSVAANQTICATAEVVGVNQTTGGGGVFALWLRGGSGAPDNTNMTFANLPNENSWTPVTSCVTATTARTSLRVQVYPNVGGPTIGVDDVRTSTVG